MPKTKTAKKNTKKKDAPAAPEPQPQINLGIHGLGRMKIFLFVDGQGGNRRPLARIQKMLSHEELKQDPSKANVFEMEDLLAIRHLVDKAIEQAQLVQTLLPRPPAPEPNPGTSAPNDRADGNDGREDDSADVL